MNLHRYLFKIPARGKAAAAFALVMALLLASTLGPLAAVAGARGPSGQDPTAQADGDGGRGHGNESMEALDDEGPFELSNPISADDFQVVASYGNSYLAENSAGKRLLYLEGDAYQRGYAEGYLCPQSVQRMSQDYLENVFIELAGEMGIGEEIRQDPWLWNLLWDVLKMLVTANQDAVPEEFLAEMQGIADACRDLGYDVSYRDLLTLNIGIDTLQSVVTGFRALLCNEFAVFGGATADGGLYHGRDFMFPTGGDVFADESLMMVHDPTQGHPFVAAAAPGFVGFPTGMNSEGVSCGMDVVNSIFTRPLVSGKGTLILCREVVQFAGSLDEGIATIRDSDRAVPWLYLIADGEQCEAAVLETFASSLLPPEDFLQRYLNRVFVGLLGLLFPGLVGSEQAVSPSGMVSEDGWEIVGGEVVGNDLAELPQDPTCPSLEKGVMMRWPDYADPDWFDCPLFASQPQEGSGLACGFFPRQSERYPDLVAMTNHYIIPLMALTYPSLAGGGGTSLWRYDTMLGLLSGSYGDIDEAKALWIIDFLNPARCAYYGTDTTQSVKGHHVLMDNGDLEMWSLHGYYDTPWVHVDLMDVLAGS